MSADGKAVARVGGLSQALIDERRAQNMVAQQIKGTVWGKQLGDAGSRALAEWCRARNIDPVLHVDVLGGRVYLNAEFYRERGAPLIQRGVVGLPSFDHMEHDDRLDALEKAGDEWARDERVRRVRLRIKHNVPEKAKAAVVCTIRVGATEVEGVNWCGGGVKANDPVGESEPSKTAESRAERRAWRRIVAVVPAFAEAVGDVASDTVEEVLFQEEARAIANIAATPKPRALVTSPKGDPLGLTDDADVADDQDEAA